MTRPSPAPPAGRDHWALDPDIVFLNHGSFGACPRSVLDVQSELRLRMERDPMRFLVHELPGLMQASRSRLASFLGAAALDVVFMDNATSAVNTVLACMPLDRDDEVVATDHGYRACNNAIGYWAARQGARLVVATIPFPIASEDQAVDAVVGSCTARTRLAVLDHVTSPTGLVMPVGKIIAALRQRGIRTLIDGAHAPGMIPLALDELGADYYTGNAHKWLCAPKGAAFLYVRRERQRELRPLVISHGASLAAEDPGRFQAEFAWTGTNDPTAWLAVEAAIEFGTRTPLGGWPARMARNRALALTARGVLCRELAVAPPCPDEMIGSLVTLPLPAGLRPPVASGATIDPLQEHLRGRWKIDVPIIAWPRPTDRVLRVSAQLYNTRGDYEQLAAALRAAR